MTMKSQSSTLTISALAAAAAALSLGVSPVFAAEELVATVSVPDFDVATNAPTVLNVPFNVGGAVTGIGFTGDWTAVVADEENGVFPWSLDLGLLVTDPSTTQSVDWHPIGGDVTIADYPLQDFTAGFNLPDGVGTFAWSFDNRESGPGSPWVMGLRNVQLHLTTNVPDVVYEYEDSTLTGPEWNRPYFIAGISSLGPVVYHAFEFTVETSGGYTLISTIDSGNHFSFLYEDAFDPQAPLDHLLEYGLGNGNAPNGAPQGTSLMEVMLFEGTTYYWVTSQWDRFSPGKPFTNVATGPGEIIPTPLCFGDCDGSGVIDIGDLNRVLGNFGTDSPAGDCNGDGMTDINDLNAVIGNFGVICLP